VWLKNRNYGAGTNHVLVDSVRGASLGLASNLTNADFSNTGNFSSINSNGFTVAGTTRDYNFLSDTFVGWQWKEGATSGFDIVTYTGNGTAGRTIAHSLGVAPQLIIAKCRSSSATNWPVFGSLLGANKYLLLNSTAASATGSPGYDNGTLATSSVFSVGSQSDINGNGATYVAYLFSEVAGFSRFGSYTGNGSADGPFVFTGFLPRWVMIKRSDSTSAWLIIDTSRQSYNVQGPYLTANTSDAETTGTTVLDVLSNGFKSRSSSTLNTNGGTYIYAAFAESPFKNALAR
jgi:hypothetical protein